VTARGNETLRRTLTTPGYPASTSLMILQAVLPLPLRRTEAIDGLSRHATWATTPTVTAERIHTARRADAGRQASHELAPADILANNTAVDVVHRVTSCRTHPGSRVPVNGVWVASVAKHRSPSSRTRNQLCNGFVAAGPGPSASGHAAVEPEDLGAARAGGKQQQDQARWDQPPGWSTPRYRC